jgi:DNA-binding response OmpR family regulator
MEKRRTKSILLIEDDPEEARLVREMLKDSVSCVFELILVESVSNAEKYLSGRSVDSLLLDLGLGLDAVRRVRAAAPHTSIVLLSSPDDEETAMVAVQEGAQDYLIKGQIEPRSLMRALVNSAARKMTDEKIGHAMQEIVLKSRSISTEQKQDLTKRTALQQQAVSDIRKVTSSLG